MTAKRLQEKRTAHNLDRKRKKNNAARYWAGRVLVHKRRKAALAALANVPAGYFVPEDADANKSQPNPVAA